MPDQWGYSTRAEIEATQRYQKDHVKQVSLKLNRSTDADIIEWLNQQGNGRRGAEGTQGAIKKAIRWMIQSQRIAAGQEPTSGCSVQPLCNNTNCEECLTEAHYEDVATKRMREYCNNAGIPCYDGDCNTCAENYERQTP